MTDDTHDDDQLLAELAALRCPEPDRERGERTRDLCHRRLALRRRGRPAWTARFLPWAQAVEAALVAALALVYLNGAVQRALVLLGR